MYNISICDADKGTRDFLEGVLGCYFKTKEVLVKIRKFERLEEMLRQSRTSDIVFMDEKTGGSDVLRYMDFLTKCNPNLRLFLLGDGYLHLDGAMDMHVFRYLSKPVDLDRLYLSLNVLLDSQKELSFMSQYLPMTLKEDEVVCVYSFERKTYVITDLGIAYPTIISIKEWERKTDGLKSFSHPHYSYIINLDYVYSFDGKKIVLHCKSGKTIEVIPSQRMLSGFKKDYLARGGILTRH